MTLFLRFIFILFILVSDFAFSKINSDPTLIFSHKRGFYNEPFTLIIDSNIENSLIYYTLDGSNPFTTQNPFIVNSPLSLEINPENTLGRDYAPGFIVRACVVQSDTLIGDPITQTYLFPNKITSLSRDNILPGPDWLGYNSGHDISYGLDPEIYNNSAFSGQMDDAFSSIPTMSLVTDLGNLFSSDSGIYVNALFHGRDWERSSSLELLNPDGTEGFQINCGLRIRGGWSRHYDNPKHAFRFIFRSEYGEGKLKYPLFGNEGVDEFDNIDLRTSQNYSWSYYGHLEDGYKNTFLREVFSRDTQRDMNQPYTRSKYYHLFINGTYWGLYQTQERSESSFAESYFGGNKDDYDVIKVDVGENFDVYKIEATDGSLEKWKELWDAGQLGFENDENYYKVQALNLDGSANPAYEKLLDVDNLIDYMIITIFVGDFDGPISGFRNNSVPNNFYAIYNRINPDGFKFFRHDAEHSLFNHDWGIDRTGPFSAGQNFMDSNPQWIHQKLSENKNYRLRFADRVYKHFYNNGALTLENILKRIGGRKTEIETAIVAESARWGDSKRSTPLTKNDWNNEVNSLLYNYMPTRQVVVLNQLMNKNLYFSSTIPSLSQHGGIVQKGFGLEINSNIGSIYYTRDGTDPFIPFGNDGTNFTKEIITPSSNKKIFIPTSDIGTSWFQNLGYNDANWITTSGGIGYDNKDVYTEFINFNTKQLMYESGTNPNTSCYIRIPFDVNSEDLNKINLMNFDIRYDDGFVVYLNGKKILEVNAPESTMWNSTSVSYLDSDGINRFNLSEFIGDLLPGQNLLAIHGLNISLQSSDFLILPLLSIGKQSNSGTISPSAQLYNSPIIINETQFIKARVQYNDEWSVLTEAKFIINEDLSTIKITELHYHPFDAIVGQDTISGKEYEFIEFKNIGESTINLTGSKFTNGIQFEFPHNSLILSGEFVVLASNSDEFEKRYGFFPDFVFTGNLDNSGEIVTFENPVADTVFSFKYNDKSPWPEDADGKGYSLVSTKRTPSSNPDQIEYWSLSASINGSPGNDDIVSNLTYNKNIPNSIQLHQNFPNPFNPTTTINFDLPNKGKVTLNIFNVLGENITTLYNGQMEAGYHVVEFSSSNYSSGVYFYRLQVGDFVDTKKMLLLK